MSASRRGACRKRAKPSPKLPSFAASFRAPFRKRLTKRLPVSATRSGNSRNRDCRWLRRAAAAGATSDRRPRLHKGMSGMQCQLCSNPATVHLTTLVGFKKKSVHLCEACANKKELLIEDKPDLNIQAVVHFMLGQQLGPEAEELSRLTCPHCGIKYMEFRGQGRLGCPHDYDAFRLGLDPI